MIELRNISCSQGSFHLRDISFHVPDGRYFVLMGKTGQGKTTLLEIICGLRRPSQGSVWVQGIDVTRWSPADRGIGYVPQDLALFPHLSVKENLAFALRLRRVSLQDLNQRTHEVAQWLGLTNLLDRSVHQLSGGEAQRVAIGRAISFQPAVLLLDEPLSALDAETRREMHDVLLKLKYNTGVTTLHVTHNEEDAIALADSTIYLDQSIHLNDNNRLHARSTQNEKTDAN